MKVDFSHCKIYVNDKISFVSSFRVETTGTDCLSKISGWLYPRHTAIISRGTFLHACASLTSSQTYTADAGEMECFFRRDEMFFSFPNKLLDHTISYIIPCRCSSCTNVVINDLLLEERIYMVYYSPWSFLIVAAVHSKRETSVLCNFIYIFATSATKGIFRFAICI